MTSTPASRFDVSIVEVLIHSTTIEAEGLVEANSIAREMWDEDGPEAFLTQSLGRTDLIIANEQEKP